MVIVYGDRVWWNYICYGYCVNKKMTSTIATNVSINSDDKKLGFKIDCYILHTVLLLIILLLIITIICYHYVKHKGQKKKTLMH